MKKILYIIPMLLLCAACAKEQEPEAQNVQVPFSITIATKAGGSGADIKPAIVNSVRVLIFNKQTSASTDPICIANEYYPFGFTTTVEEDGTTLVAVNPTIYLETPQVREYDVFVVLNEEGYTLTSGNLLNDVLSDVELNSNESAFTAILATKAEYTVTTEEPAMLMSAGQTVTYTSAETPIQVHFNATTDPSRALKRTMAMISVDKIVSQPSADGTGTYDKELPKIFVLSASIENVPGGIDWDSTEDGAAGSDKVSLPLGEANADGYYDRNWEGSVYADVAVKVEKIEKSNVLLYKSTWTPDNTDAEYKKNGDFKNPRKLNVNIKNEDKKGWSFIPEDAVDFCISDIDLAYDFNNVNASYEAFLKNVYNVAVKYKEACEFNYLKSDILPALFADDCNISDCVYSIVELPAIDDKHPGTTNVRCSEDSWSIKIDSTYYVPENISSTATDATFIKIKLALADPSLALNKGITVNDLPSPDYVNEGATTQYDYFLRDGDAVDMNHFKPYCHVVNADDETIEYTSENTVNNFHLYYDGGFSRKAKGKLDATSVINQNQKKSTFSWNIPKTDDATTHVYEFKIPVNNNLGKDGDYSIHRNTKYNVSLKVGSTTYGQLVTKSGEGESALTVTATVTTEKINDNED